MTNAHFKPLVFYSFVLSSVKYCGLNKGFKMQLPFVHLISVVSDFINIFIVFSDEFLMWKLHFMHRLSGAQKQRLPKRSAPS